MFALSPHTPAVLDDSFTTFFQFFHLAPRDIRLGNPERPFWQGWYYDLSLYGLNCTSEEYQHEKCWGWNILRTSYDDDEKFTQAVSAIQRLALVRLEDEYHESRTRGKPDNEDANAAVEKLDQVPGRRHPPNFYKHVWSAMVEPAQDALPEGEPLTPDWVITHELMRRYHNIILQDREALDGADVSKAWEYAHALKLRAPEPGPRGMLFIYLDKESINHLARAPSQEELASMAPADRSKTAWKFWVKVVSTACEVSEDHEDTDQMAEDPLRRRRIRLYDLFETFLYLCEGCLPDITVEGWGRERWDRERFLEHGAQEWELCENHDGTIQRHRWLQELYGEVVRMY